jgi:hypothetical protein
MTKDTLHVVPHDGSWAVKREGKERPNSTHKTQREAIDAARDLATEGDELVIHRLDGAVRGHTTYTPPAHSQTSPNNSTPAATRPSDVMSVGTRVSWAAVIAGVVVAMAAYVSLNLLVLAIGLSTIDQMGTKTFVVSAAAASTLCLLVALFVGGFVASTSTVGEEKAEAMTNGVLVWATMLVLLFASGTGLGVGFFAGIRDIGKSGEPGMTAEALKQELNLTDQQAERYTTVLQRGQSLTGKVSPAGLAWWTFGGVVVSILAAVGGSLAGAGPELLLKRLHSRRVAVLSRPA